jgi:Ca2+-binding RTX toxin-like protein
MGGRLVVLVTITVALTACTSKAEQPGGVVAPVDPTPSPSTAGRAANTSSRTATVNEKCFNRKPTIVGTPVADRLQGTRKRDVIVALGGNDVIGNLGEHDVVCAGVGDDVIRPRGRDSAFLVDLGPGDDRFLHAHAYSVGGGPGDDRIVVDSPVNVAGGPGDDHLQMTRTLSYRYPSNGPCVSFRSSSRSVRVDLERGWARGEGRDRVIGFRCLTATRHDDVIAGTDRRDGINALAGADLVHAGAANDVVSGGPNADRIYLGAGHDSGYGDQGWDRLYGESGSDVLEGWSEGDYLDGGTGDDQIYAALFCSIGGNSYDTAGLLDSAGNELFGGPGDDYLVGDKGNDRLDGGPGFDHGQGGYRDGRIDWIDATEHLIDGCLPHATVYALFPLRWN